MNKQTSKKISPGDIYAIPLPNEKYAFGRVFRGACIAIYRHIGDSVQEIPQTEDYQFIVGVYESALKSGSWMKVDHRPFATEDEQWAPPMCIIDKISGKYKIYHQGKIRSSSKSECEGLEIAAVWEVNHIVDRIMGEDKWHRR